MDIDMESKIFECVDNNDVEGLKLLTNYPDFFQIEDDYGYPILQKAIWDNKIEVFDFLLSLDGCPINARSYKGTTALEIAHHFYSEERGEHFVYSLLKKGAEIDCCGIKTWLLYNAIVFNHIKVAKYLIEKGADLNSYYNEYLLTPLHVVILLEGDGDRSELFAMLLYFGADPSIPDAEGYKPIDYALADEYSSESMGEQLVFYFFDDYCTDYEIPLDRLFDLLESHSPLAPQVIKHITSVNVHGDLETSFFELFTIKPAHLKFLLEKFDYVIEAILDYSLEKKFVDWHIGKDIFTENFDLLFQSQFNSDVIQVINNKIRIYNFFEQGIYFTMPRKKLFDLILFMLSYGANIYDYELERIYKLFGDCEFFRTLLHMDIKTGAINDIPRYYGKYEIMPGLLYNIHIDSETFRSNYPHKYGCSLKALEQLLKYFANPKLENLSHELSDEDIRAKMKDLPSVPLLVELARNKVRNFLIQKYKIQNSMQFYTLIKNLPISKIHQKIITLETKLYY